MADDTPEPDSGTVPAPKKPWLKRIRRRISRVYHALDDRWVQRRFGKFADQRDEIFAQLKKVAGGAEALEAAKENNVKIKVVSPRRIDGVKGRFSPRKSGPLLRVSSCGDIPRMTSTLWHELRHMIQRTASGDLGGGTTRLLDTRVQHMMSLMMEADAYTSQTLMCLQQKKAGRPEYLDAFLKRDSEACQQIKRFLDKRPYESYPADAAFARALFVDVMKHGLAAYQQKYFNGYRKAFKKAATPQGLARMVAGRKSRDVIPSEELLKIYGQKPGTGLSIRPLALGFYDAQDKDTRETLALVEDTVKNAPAMTQEQFKAARAEVVSRTGRAAKSHRNPFFQPYRLNKRMFRHGK